MSVGVVGGGIDVILLPVTIAPDLVLCLIHRSTASLSLETTRLVYPLLIRLAKVPEQHLVTLEQQQIQY